MEGRWCISYEVKSGPTTGRQYWVPGDNLLWENPPPTGPGELYHYLRMFWNWIDMGYEFRNVRVEFVEIPY